MPEIFQGIHFTHIHTNGAALHVAQAGPVDGPLVILLHGFPEYWYGWRHQIGFLSGLGYRVWAPDQRGYYLSDKPRGVASYQLPILASDIVGLIDAAKREKAVIVGHDWGAAVAWALALYYPDRVEKLGILNVPHPQVMLDTVRRDPSQWLKSWYVGLFQFPVLPELLMQVGDYAGLVQAMISTSRPGTFGDEDIARYIEAWKQPGALTAMLNWYRAIVQYAPTFPDNLRIRVPTQIIWGKQDAFLKQEMAKKSIEFCDNGRLALLETTHWVQHEASAQVNQLLAELFAG